MTDKLKPMHDAFWFLTISILLVLTLPTLIKHGMFMDAVLYTAVSHNLAQGTGTFWFPYFDTYNIVGLPSFHEQPPLVFGIQSLFFRCLGSSMYVERFYTFITMAITAFMIALLWKTVHQKNMQQSQMAWLPLILWISIPVCFWSYSNNMHENTMGIFTISSVYFGFKAMEADSNKWLYIFWAALFICMAVLCKGFPGFFPLTVPFLHWLVFRKKTFGKTILYTALMLCVLSCFGLCLYYYPDAHQSLSVYLFKRVFQRISNAHSVNSRFFIFWRLLSELIPALAFTGFVFMMASWKKIKTPVSSYQKQAIFFFLTGCCGSLPLMLTLVQNGFYFVPSLPFFGIGFALLSAPVIEKWIQGIPPEYKSRFWYGSMLLLVFVLIFAFSQKNKFSRDKELLHDIDMIATVVPKRTVINCPNTVAQNNELMCYLVRMYDISLNNISYKSLKSDFFLVPKNSVQADSAHYQKISLNTLMYTLYKKR